jgi:hypothetical protein
MKFVIHKLRVKYQVEFSRGYTHNLLAYLNPQSGRQAVDFM